MFAFNSERRNRIRYRAGISIKNSEKRMIAQSVIPPKYPAIPPKSIARTRLIKLATKPIVREIRLP